MSPIRQGNHLLILTVLLLLVLSLAGCGSSNSQSNFDSASGQHPAGWLPDGHMTAAKASLETCTSCHGADYTGGISKIACTDCHIGNQQSIHPTSWGPFGYILHADYVKTNGNSSCANASCHGATLTGVSGSGPSCTSCHMGGVASMHPLWGTPDYAMHGSYVKSNGNDTSGCANAKCHGTNLDGVGGAGPSCTSCHMGGVASMHPLWGTPDYAKHGSYVKNNGNDTSGCANVLCHGTSLDGVGGTGPSCTSCHMGVTAMHPLWGTPDYAMHGIYVKKNGNDTSGCANVSCHGAQLDGVGGTGPSCASCHMGGVTAMHPLWGSPDYVQHGTYVKSNNGDTSRCANIACHGATLTGVNGSGPSCTSCHIGSGQSIHPVQWGAFGFIRHADYVRANTNSTCANVLCHGAQLDGAGGTGPSCSSCHMGGVALMHPPWGTPAYAMHGSYVKSLSNDTSGCANATCHGTTLTGVNGSGPSCSSCHMGGVASIHPPWGTPVYAQHETYVQSNSGDTSRCANIACHGATLTGVSGSGPSCTLCHMGGVASVHPAEWNGNVLIHKTKVGFTNIESCKNIVCHGAALEGVYLSGSSCYICH